MLLEKKKIQKVWVSWTSVFQCGGEKHNRKANYSSASLYKGIHASVLTPKNE